MTADTQNELSRWLEGKPMILVRFEEDFSEGLREHGLDRFTLTVRHGAAENMKLPTLCLAEISEDGKARCYVGVLKSKSAVATFNSRLTFLKFRQLDLRSLASLPKLVAEKRLRSLLQRQLSDLAFSAVLSPKLSSSIVNALWKNRFNRSALESTLPHLPRFRRLSTGEWGQRDAIKLAMAAFGLGSSEKPVFTEVVSDSDSTISQLDTRLLEDNVIGADASAIPGFSLIEKSWTGHAVFEKGLERLDVYTANRGPLEKMLGVDLIYVNTGLGSSVMVQYKMLEDARKEMGDSPDWTFRPDPQLKAEMARMKIPALAAKADDYRLHKSPFYFKFVKRRGSDDSTRSFIISHEHLAQLLKSPSVKGPKGGVRISYRALNGTYLRETDLIGLIRSGYIGTHRVETESLAPIIAEVANGDRALVMAWQSRVQIEVEE